MRDKILKNILNINFLITIIIIVYLFLGAFEFQRKDEIIFYAIMFPIVLLYNSWLIRKEIFYVQASPGIIASSILLVLYIINTLTSLKHINNFHWDIVISIYITLISNTITYSLYYFIDKKK